MWQLRDSELENGWNWFSCTTPTCTKVGHSKREFHLVSRVLAILSLENLWFHWKQLCFLSSTHGQFGSSWLLWEFAGNGNGPLSWRPNPQVCSAFGYFSQDLDAGNICSCLFGIFLLWACQHEVENKDPILKKSHTNSLPKTLQLQTVWFEVFLLVLFGDLGRPTKVFNRLQRNIMNHTCHNWTYFTHLM